MSITCTNGGQKDQERYGLTGQKPVSVDLTKINAMLRYLHVFAMNASQKLSSSMPKHGAFTFNQAQVTEDDPAAFPCETPKEVIIDLTLP